MKDLKILNGAIDFQNGDWVLVNGINRTIQHIKVALKTLKNDWILDYRKGVNYFDNLKALDDETLKAEVKRAVREVNGVDKITKFNFERKGTNISIKITVLIGGEPQTITEGFSL